jgi:hypothetical protein
LLATLTKWPTSCGMERSVARWAVSRNFFFPADIERITVFATADALAAILRISGIARTSKLHRFWLKLQPQKVL